MSAIAVLRPDYSAGRFEAEKAEIEPSAVGIKADTQRRPLKDWGENIWRKGGAKKAGRNPKLTS